MKHKHEKPKIIYFRLNEPSFMNYSTINLLKLSKSVSKAFLNTNV